MIGSTPSWYRRTGRRRKRRKTHADTGFRRETDTDSQYIDYSYTYNPICLRCKMHRFYPKDWILLVTASLEERASEGRVTAALAYVPRAVCRYRYLLECLLDLPRACVSIPPQIAPSEFDCRVLRERWNFSPYSPPRSSGILILWSATRVDAGKTTSR